MVAVPHAADHLRQAAKLDAQDGCSQFIESAAAAPTHRRFVLHAEVVLSVAGVTGVVTGQCPAEQQFVVRDDAARLSAGDVLVDLETEDREIPKVSDFPSSQRSAETLRAVFQKIDAVLSCDRGDLDGVSGSAIHVDQDDAGGARCKAAAHGIRRKAEGVVDLSEHGNRAQVDDGSDDCHPEISRYDDFLPRSDAQRGERGV